MEIIKKKLAVIGSRTCIDKELVFRVLDRNEPKISLIISGGASGADTIAVEWATARGKPYLVFPALWHDKDGKFDRGAGFKRNHEIVRNSDAVLAFYDGISKGTQHSMDITKKLNKPLKVILFTPKPKEEPKKTELPEIPLKIPDNPVPYDSDTL